MSSPLARIRRWIALSTASLVVVGCNDRGITTASEGNGEAPPPITVARPGGATMSVSPGGVTTFTQTISSGYRFGQYLYYNGDWGWAHNFPNWNLSGINILSAKLTIVAWDVDAEPFWGLDGEYDAISVDGVRLNPGFLQGANATWSTTVFDIPVSSITDDGAINAFIDIDIYHTTPTWATQLSSSTLEITYSVGPVNGVPFMPTLAGTPGAVVDNDDELVVSVTGPSPADPDGDAVTYEYRWFLNTGSGGFLDPSVHGRGTFTTSSIPASATRVNDEWRVQVTPRDANGAIGPFGIYTFAKVTEVVDDTPPVIAPTVTGTAGSNGWFTSDVQVSWAVSDGQSPVTSMAGCTPSSVTENTTGTVFTCSATSTGGTATQSVTVKRDATPPVIAPIVGGTMGSNGWYTSNVSVAFSSSDDVSGITSAPCAPNGLATDTPGVSYTCSATNGAGLAASATVTVKRDATDPTVSLVGNAGAYTVDQTIGITCAASDAMSGLASQTCNGAAGDAFALGLGTHAVSASATDNAGNTAAASGTFTVSVTHASLCTLVRRWVTDAGVANSMCKKLENAAAANARGGSSAGVMGALINELEAQAGKKVPASRAATLIALAQALM